MKKISAILLSACLLCFSAKAERYQRTINSCWQFTQFGKTETVNIPHNWNSYDCQDEIPGYYRGIGEYSKEFTITRTTTKSAIRCLMR